MGRLNGRFSGWAANSNSLLDSSSIPRTPRASPTYPKCPRFSGPDARNPGQNRQAGSVAGGLSGANTIHYGEMACRHLSIERGFRIMKNHLDIAPVHHRLPDRIRAHMFVCFLALVIQRRLRYRSHRSPLGGPPEALLYLLRPIQRHSVRLATGKNLNGPSAIPRSSAQCLTQPGSRFPPRSASKSPCSGIFRNATQ